MEPIYWDESILLYQAGGVLSTDEPAACRSWSGRPWENRGLRADGAPAGPGGKRTYGFGQNPGGSCPSLPADSRAALRGSVLGCGSRLSGGRSGVFSGFVAAR